MIAAASVCRQGRDSSSTYSATTWADELLDALEVAAKQACHLRGRDMMLGIVEPAVIVGRDGDRAVAELRLARPGSFRNVRHADQVGARVAQKEAFGAGSEPRAFDARIGLVLVEGQLQRRADAGNQSCGRCAGRVRRRNMRDEPAAEEGRRPQALGEIEILRRQSQIAGPDLLAQAADRGDPMMVRAPRLLSAQMLPR